ncbi:MAG: hypothetical protein ACR2JV_08575 [Gaiellales bacterium]
MSRAARNSKILRSGAIGFVAGVATLGVVAHGSPAHDLVTGALGVADPATALADGARHAAHHRATESRARKQSLDAWLKQQLQDSEQQYQQPQQQDAQPAQPQYQQPQQQNVQPAPAQPPQSQAS